jgi:hypothetical protein
MTSVRTRLYVMHSGTDLNLIWYEEKQWKKIKFRQKFIQTFLIYTVLI